MSKLKFIRKYIKYKFTKKYKEAQLSPFLYNVVEETIKNDLRYYAFDEIENLRKELLTDNSTIKVTDYGAGSKVMKSNERKIKNITKYSARDAKFGRFIFRLVNQFKPKKILEIGTSLGIGTLYIAKINSKNTIYTLEGCPKTAEKARENFTKLNAQNIDVTVGEFSKTLNPTLEKMQNIDFVIFDGNHKKEPTLSYFEQCLPYLNKNAIFVFDDIHWSDEMEEAWIKIISHPKVKTNIDLFFMGIVFLQ